jgi:translation initiation factor eIF-2B subunit alpha/methylthioribose-1-phosphate isomerase
VKIKGKDYRSVWMEDSRVKLIDQRLIPHEFRIKELKTVPEVADAIKTMVVRGAPAIGATACYGMALAALTDFNLGEAEGILSSTRPTAHDLFDGIRYFKDNYDGGDAAAVAGKYADESAERCRLIGIHGAKLIKDGARILTHCNAGALACVDWGTALAPIRVARDEGKGVHVWVDETRPRCQGAMLTAWELMQEGISHKLLADNAAGYLMAAGQVDLVVVGADRIALNGDVANKIGTYEKAVLARENDIPFYVAAPSSTFDITCPDGEHIPIEERGLDEVTHISGVDGEGRWTKVRITYKGCKAVNPAFDITPAEYITAVITEEGLRKYTF